MQVAAIFNSVWDGCYEITTNCLVDIQTGIVTPEVSTEEEVEALETLEREYVSIASGAEFHVECNDENEHVLSDLSAFRVSIGFSA